MNDHIYPHRHWLRPRHNPCTVVDTGRPPLTRRVLARLRALFLRRARPAVPACCRQRPL